MKKTEEEIVFDKYEHLGAYHWEQCSSNLKTMNAHVIARYKVVINCLVEFSISTPVQVLDAGCGDGALTALICRLDHRVYGVDTNSQAIRLARDKFKVNNLSGNFCVIEGYNYPFKNNFFEVITCSDVIEHVQKPAQMLKEIYRVLKTGGILIISTPIKNRTLPISKNHVQEWKIDEFENLCAAIFGKPVKSIISHPLFYYKLYTSKNKYIRRPAKLSMNVFSSLGMNVFLKTAGKAYSRYQMQTLVLKKND